MMIKLLAQQTDLHDIAGPVDYSLIPTWVIFAGCVIGLLVAGLVIWQIRKYLAARKPTPLTPRERARRALNEAGAHSTAVEPYAFSIRVSDIVRRYVLEQFDLPMTRQTSLEFLNAIREKSTFTPDERTLLADFLERCDLIKFARYGATADDNVRLIEEAQRFVQGGEVVHA